MVSTYKKLGNLFLHSVVYQRGRREAHHGHHGAEGREDREAHIKQFEANQSGREWKTQGYAKIILPNECLFKSD